MRRLFHFLAGETSLTLPKSSAAAAIETIRRAGLSYSDMKTTGESVVLSASFLTARKIEKELRAAEIEFAAETHGLPRILYRYRYRWGIAIGMLLFAVGITVSSRYIWCFEITGNKTVSDEEVIAGLTELGCGIGSRRDKIAFDDVENEFALRSDRIAWISVNIKGTTAHVEVREVKDGTGGDKTGKCANLVARESGEIVYLDVSSGRAAVRSGDVVREGELLVSGINESKSGKLRYEYAEGRVMARVTRLIHVEVSSVKTEKVYTGRETVDREINIFGKVINLFGKGGNEGEKCDMIVTSEKFSFFRDETLPVYLTTRLYREYELVSETVSEEEAVAAAMAEFRRQMDEALLDAELLEKTVTTEFTDGVYCLDCRLYVLTDIAETRDIPVGTDEENDGTKGNQRAE